MEKIKTIFIIILLLSLSCKTKVNQPPIFKIKGKKIDSTEKSVSKDLSCYHFLGEWSFLENNKSQDFHLSLNKNDKGIVGVHCFVKGENGEMIDCGTDKSVFLECNDSIAKGEIESTYAEELIKVEFKLIAKDTFQLKVLNDIGQSFFYEKMIFVRKN